MKVYELMTILEKAPAGAEVVVNMKATLNADVESAEMDDGVFLISARDAEVIDTNGNSLGFLTALAEAD